MNKVNILIKLFNFVRTQEVNRFTHKYFYLIFLYKGNDAVIKLMQLRIAELEAKEQKEG